MWTLTATERIDRVILAIEGVQETWPTDGDDAEVLTRDDYRSFDPEFVEEPEPTPEPIEEPTATPDPDAEPTPTEEPADGE